MLRLFGHIMLGVVLALTLSPFANIYCSGDQQDVADASLIVTQEHIDTLTVSFPDSAYSKIQ